VLFFSPTCRHCHQVITQYLPALFGSYGGTPSVTTDETVPQGERCAFLFHSGELEILLVDASKPVGTELYQASTRNQEIPPDSTGVPRLVIGDVYLVGSIEIPELTGDLVRQGLDQGGLGWPAIDGLGEAVASIPGVATVVGAEQEDSTSADVAEAQDSAATEPMPSVDVDNTQPEAALHDTAPTAVGDSVVDQPIDTLPTGVVDTVADLEPDTAASTPSPFEVIQPQELSMLENFRLDPVGNSISVVVLLLMIVSIVVLGLKAEVLPARWGRGFGIPLLALIGAFVASYLTYIEATGAIAVCGPVGDCNTVNQSEYAQLFGVLPVGALGLVGFVAISLAWSASRYTSGPTSTWASLSVLVMTVGGTLFSIYLTFLEPFVIGATCVWCLTSSVIITVLMWLSAGSGQDAWLRIRGTGAGATM
jgi:uncharacterized membrane protein